MCRSEEGAQWELGVRGHGHLPRGLWSAGASSFASSDTVNAAVAEAHKGVGVDGARAGPEQTGRARGPTCRSLAPRSVRAQSPVFRRRGQCYIRGLAF